MHDKFMRMPDNSPHILVIGGGIGGLCLANGLRRAGVSAAVYERTRTRTDWLQGYRIHISPHGAAALHACLPPAQWEAFVATTGKPSAGFAFLTEQLRDLLFLPRGLLAGEQAGPEASHHSVSRITLRHVLLDGLGDLVHLGKEFTHYEQAPDGRVTAFFADGTTATGDVLVGADGANSRVRQQYLPEAHRIDTGVVAVAGKLPLTDETRAWLPERLSGSVSNIMPPRDSFMFTAVWEGDRQRLASSDPAMPQGLLFDNTQDYVFWAYAARRATYPAEPPGDGTRLRDMIASMIDGWHPALSRLVTQCDPATVAPVIIRAMAPVRPWPASPITLLGDAIHNMTPMAGVGANTALRDSSLLASNLANARQETLVTAISEYETAMREYGFAAVKLSLRNTRQATSGPISRAAFRAMLRATNALPPLKRQFARAFGR
jgi:2-polyprenyl-6-methoxyphenol hydroxylase-like FAD-dependent oxidoreductase